MFKVCDKVFYGAHGVCEILEIKSCSIAGEVKEYYILKPVYQPHSTLYVPVTNQALTSKMHPLLSREEIEELINTMPQEETLWLEDDTLRKETYNKILAGGERKKIVQIIKTLYLEQSIRHSLGKRLRQSDEQILGRAEDLLYHEFALVLNISPDQVLPLLQRKIELPEREKQA